MTSKNKYIKTLDKFLDIMKSKSKPSFYENEKDQIAEDLITACKKADLYDELTQEPTLSECIKEWEDRGYIIEIGITHIWFSTVDGNIIATFDLCDKCVTTSLFIDYELSVLITKTLKALENNNETK